MAGEIGNVTAVLDGPTLMASCAGGPALNTTSSFTLATASLSPVASAETVTVSATLSVMVTDPVPPAERVPLRALLPLLPPISFALNVADPLTVTLTGKAPLTGLPNWSTNWRLNTSVPPAVADPSVAVTNM